MQSKKELREEMADLRDMISKEDHAKKSKTIAGHLSKWLLQQRIRSIGGFWPFRSEVDLRPFYEVHPDLIFLFPRVISTDPPRLAWGPEPLEPGMWGLMEPSFAQHFTPPVDLLLVPGLAFDAGGFRLGYGKGFYDALLAHLDAKVMTLGVAFDCQRIDELEVGPLDQAVQGLITESGLHGF
jgi:5-formyltetrahydrofolate cyclo-ligase